MLYENIPKSTNKDLENARIAAFVTESEFFNSLSESKQKAYDEVCSANIKYNSLIETEIFLYAFRLGARLMLDIIYND